MQPESPAQSARIVNVVRMAFIVELQLGLISACRYAAASAGGSDILASLFSAATRFAPQVSRLYRTPWRLQMASTFGAISRRRLGGSFGKR
jgi:hypothetical protein